MDHDDAHTDRPSPGEDGELADLRLGDADRTAALDALGQHLEAGRLDVEEFGERSVRASIAVRCSDLRPLFADLPAPHPPLPRPPSPEQLVPAPRRAEPTPFARVPQRHHPGLPPALRAGVLAAAVALPVMLILATGPGSGGLLVLPLLLVLLGGLRHGGPGGPGHGHRHGPGGGW
ncbi:DUF1707 SHOCT-like domain-containing protein [Actinomycetospora sp. CA-101289]|uniref:DUF1707 SHOCT-like domain-containing protein n=1 Tax=Actinomycetospora sp. CA-101289 TaxID=3239893 RepID=UPI003D98C5B9